MKFVNAEILSVGTEIIIGDIVDTHSQYISKLLCKFGINVFYHSSVGDNETRIIERVKDALNRSDLVIVTGGLGPTADDMSKECVAKALGLELELDESILNNIKQYFDKLGREMTQNNIKQAYVPKGAKVIQNDYGTAPGILIETNNKAVVLMPGPPRELHPMTDGFLTDYLEKNSNKVIYSNVVKIVGIGESRIETMLGEMMDNQNPTVALYAKECEVHLRVTSKADSKEQAIQMNKAQINKIQEILGENIYGVDVENLQTSVVQKLIEKGKKLATAESCTGGLVSQMITSVSGSSEVFDMGICSYGNKIKANVLSVSTNDLKKYGAVSEQVAIQMAQGVKKLANADYAISITGIAGPTGGTKEKPVGTVYIGLATPDKVTAKRFEFGQRQTDCREFIRTMSAISALKMLHDTLK